MILKKEIKKEINKNVINKILFISLIICLSIITIPTLLISKSATFKKQKTILLDKVSRSGRYEYIFLPKILFHSIKANFSSFEKLNLDINFKYILKLENLREQSLKEGSLPPRDMLPKIKLDIIHQNKKFSGDARLKGDRIIHFEKKKNTSYKIELDRDNYLFGVKKFSLQKPIVRNYVHEWIFLKLAGDFDLIRLTYKFIYLNRNGENLGLFVFEEGFGKELIERNKRRDGPIFGLNEDLNFTNINPVFEIYNKKFWERDENKKIKLAASEKLKLFFENKLYTKDVFDLEKWASYFAIIDLTGTWHGALLKSVKFYYNPLSGLFEPIPFDGHRFKPNYNRYNQSYDNKLVIDFVNNLSEQDRKTGLGWIESFFYKNGNLDKHFYNLYSKNLFKISSPSYIQNFLDQNLTEINKINSHIYKDSFLYHDQSSGMGIYYFSLDDFHYQAKNIRDKLNIEGGLQILENKKESKYLIKDYFNSYAPLKVNKLICSKSLEIKEFVLENLINNFSETIIEIPYKNYKNCNQLGIVNLLNNKEYLYPIDYINSHDNQISFKDKNSLNYNDFFYKKAEKLYLKKNEVVIDKDVFIPENLEVVIEEGQRLYLINEAFIFSKSPIKIGGNNSSTLVSGYENNLGGGIIVDRANNISIIKNTNFRYLKGLPQNKYSEYIILGSINFHETNVNIINSTFNNIYSEDVINIFRSNFVITNSYFENVNSDAIDIDFGKGKILSSKFINIKNDAIDFSGSEALVDEVYFENVNDKLISVGEKSNVIIQNVNGINSRAGIVSKDGSITKSKKIIFKNVAIPFAAYQKKKAYEYGFLDVKEYKIENYYLKWIKDKDSKILGENEILKKSNKDVFFIVNEKKLFF